MYILNNVYVYTIYSVGAIYIVYIVCIYTHAYKMRIYM